MQSNAAHPPSLMRETLRMAWPAVLESFFVALASMIDTLMVSSLGSTAVAAVGLTVQPKFLGFEKAKALLFPETKINFCFVFFAALFYRSPVFYYFIFPKPVSF